MSVRYTRKWLAALRCYRYNFSLFWVPINHRYPVSGLVTAEECSTTEQCVVWKFCQNLQGKKKNRTKEWKKNCWSLCRALQDIDDVFWFSVWSTWCSIACQHYKLSTIAEKVSHLWLCESSEDTLQGGWQARGDPAGTCADHHTELGAQTDPVLLTAHLKCNTIQLGQ